MFANCVVVLSLMFSSSNVPYASLIFCSVYKPGEITDFLQKGLERGSAWLLEVCLLLRKEAAVLTLTLFREK